MPALHLLDLTPAQLPAALATSAPSVMGFSWDPRDKFLFDNVEYRHIESSPEGQLFKVLDGTGEIVLFTDEAIYKLMLSVDSYHRWPKYFTAANLKALKVSAERLVSDLSPKDQATIHFRLALVLTVLRQFEGVDRPTDEELNAAILAAYREVMDARNKKKQSGEEVFHFRKPALSTWKTWRDRYRSFGDTAIALLDLRGNSGNRTERFPTDLRELIDETIKSYLTTSRPTVKDVYSQMLVKLFKLNHDRIRQGLLPRHAPHISTLYAHVAKIDKWLKTALRFSVDTANRKYRGTGTGIQVAHPGARTEIDGWTIDLFTLVNDCELFADLTAEERKALKPIRLVVTVLIDHATHCVTGFHLSVTENSRASISAMRLSVEPKNELAKKLGCESDWPMYSWGTMVSDSAFSDDETASIAVDAFGQTAISPIGIPWMRPIIERFFRTMANQLVAYFTGRSFASITLKGDYKAEQYASVTFDELRDALLHFIVDVYHHTKQDDLGMTPYLAWFHLGDKHKPFAPMDKNRLAAVFGIRLTRRLHGDGITFWNQQYNSVTLQRVMRKHGISTELNIKVDPMDLGLISVEVPVNERDEPLGVGPFNRKAWIKVPGPEELRGITLWQYEAAVEAFHAKWGPQIQESEKYRQAGLAFLAALGRQAAERLLTHTAPSSAYLEEASLGFFPGLTKDRPSQEALAEMHGSSIGATAAVRLPAPVEYTETGIEFGFDDEE